MLRLVITIFMVLSFSINLLAISEEEESRLLLKVISAGATTPEQKSLVQKYIASIIEKKQAEAEKYRQLARSNEGGKIATQRAKKLEYLKKAASIENQIKEYKTLASRYVEVAMN